MVIDVVEGTALASLPHMSAILARRPPSFPSLRVALEWAQHQGARAPLNPLNPVRRQPEPCMLTPCPPSPPSASPSSGPSTRMRAPLSIP